jgi:uncharacterized radical SAM protein YgiQ
MFLPTTKDELKKFGWEKLDIILISGDTYIDSPFIGVAVIGNYLFSKGFRVGIIAQPDINSNDIARLGEPELYWGVSAGAMDSLVANWTSTKKFRNNDDLTPGGINDRRPDRACMVYSNLIRKFFKNTKPIVLGGVEASLRRIVHYDFKDNDLRRSILFDSKADILVYGMGEKSMLGLANSLKNGKDFSDINGICYISKENPKENPKENDFIEIPSFEDCKKDKNVFEKAFMDFYKNCVDLDEKRLIQKHDNRYLVHNPKQSPLTQQELDEVYDLDYTREVHPFYAKIGIVKAQETIKFSITTHRGCFGECNFCSIAIHQGKQVVSRSKKSILKEAQNLANRKDFKGYINDLGGPTANMFESKCKINGNAGKCKIKRCLFPETCENLVFGHNEQIELLQESAKIKNVKKVFLSSGIRFDMICNDKKNGQKYLEKILVDNISGQMKIAPEHCDEKILKLMGKPSKKYLEKFIDMFGKATKSINKKEFLTYYFIASYPGCTEKEMMNLQNFIGRNIKFSPEQVQIFTPTPSTLATMMYWTGRDLDGNKIFVEKDLNKKQKQKMIICKK